jgi:adenosine deaminase
MSDGAPFLPPPADPALRQMPKCNVHTHLEGSVRPSTWWELARAQGLSSGRLEQADALLQVDGNEHSLVDYLAKISRTYPVLKNREALRRTAFEAAEDAANDGVVYFELRAGPMIHAGPGLPVEAVIESMLEGLRQAEARVGIVARLIVAALRHHPPEANVQLAKAAVAYRDQGVVAFDLAGDEEGFPAPPHAEAFAVARRRGLGITVHAGEAAGAENVVYAVESMGATRIGHGVHSIESDAAVDMLEQRGILLEICPTSNVHTGAVSGMAAHPVRRLYDRGVSISIGDDDPTTSRTRVSNELTLLRQRFGFTPEELAGIQRATLEAAFLRESEARARVADMLASHTRTWGAPL